MPQNNKIDFTRKNNYNIVIDTDAANETDDQFALIYALMSPEIFNIQAIYAAPFKHYRVFKECEGMHNSFDEINKILEYFPDKKIPSFHGAENFLADRNPIKNDVANDLIERAKLHNPDNPLYVVCIASLTNLATALLLEPSITDRIVVLWLGGQLYDRSPVEFNLEQDFTAAQIVFESKIKMINFPCQGVCEKLTMSLEEALKKLPCFGEIGEFLKHRFIRHHTWSFGESASDEQVLSIWDFAPIAFLLNQNFCATRVMQRPELLGNPTRWGACKNDMNDIVCIDINRDAIFDDFYQRLTKYKTERNHRELQNV
ncbi:MAG: nucleoside hydrolase [Lentisphaeria bacterium]